MRARVGEAREPRAARRHLLARDGGEAAVELVQKVLALHVLPEPLLHLADVRAGEAALALALAISTTLAVSVVVAVVVAAAKLAGARARRLVLGERGGHRVEVELARGEHLVLVRVILVGVAVRGLRAGGEQARAARGGAGTGARSAARRCKPSSSLGPQPRDRPRRAARLARAL